MPPLDVLFFNFWSFRCAAHAVNVFVPLHFNFTRKAAIGRYVSASKRLLVATYVHINHPFAGPVFLKNPLRAVKEIRKRQKV